MCSARSYRIRLITTATIQAYHNRNAPRKEIAFFTIRFLIKIRMANDAKFIQHRIGQK